MVISFECNLKNYYEIVEKLVADVFEFWSALLKHEVDVLTSERLSLQILVDYRKFMSVYQYIQKHSGDVLLIESIALRLH